LFLDEKFSSHGAASVASAVPQKQGFNVKVIAAAFAAGLVLALIPASLYLMRSADPPPAAARLQVEIPLPGVLGVISVSPDGQRVAYIGQAQDEERGIWLRPTGSETPQKLPGTEGANTGLFWSPDSRYLGFVADGKLKKADVLGGLPQALTDFTGNARGFAWNSDGVILFAKTPENVLLQISDAGGEVKKLTTLDEGRKETLHAGPVFLPDGNRYLFLIAAATAENSGIFVGSLDGAAPKRLMPLPPQINSLAYASGYLVYSNGPVVMAQRFDLDSLTLEGEPKPVADGAQNANFSVSNTGLLIYRKGAIAPPNKHLVWFDRTGKRSGEFGAEANYGSFELAPKGDRAAVDMIANNNRDIWVIDIARGVPSRITHDAANDWSPSWSGDGSRLLFASARRGGNDIYQKSSSGVGNDELVYESNKNEIPVHLSPDGRYAVFSRPRPQGGPPGNDTWVFDLKEKKEFPFVESPFDKIHGRISPNGRWIAYSTNDSGMYQIVVQSFPDPNGGKWQITAQGGVEPKWRRDGRELFYLALDGKLMAVPTKIDSAFEAGAAEELFTTPLTVARPTPSRDRRYDVAPDGRFLILTPVGPGTTASVVGVVNWASSLDQ
jgi:Tol biopolymer transport system component